MSTKERSVESSAFVVVPSRHDEEKLRIQMAESMDRARCRARNMAGLQIGLELLDPNILSPYIEGQL